MCTKECASLKNESKENGFDEAMDSVKLDVNSSANTILDVAT